MKSNVGANFLHVAPTVSLKAEEMVLRERIYRRDFHSFNFKTASAGMMRIRVMTRYGMNWSEAFSRWYRRPRNIRTL